MLAPFPTRPIFSHHMPFPISELIADIRACEAAVEARGESPSMVRVNQAIMDCPRRRAAFLARCERLGITVVITPALRAACPDKDNHSASSFGERENGDGDSE